MIKLILNTTSYWDEKSISICKLHSTHKKSRLLFLLNEYWGGLNKEAIVKQADLSCKRQKLWVKLMWNLGRVQPWTRRCAPPYAATAPASAAALRSDLVGSKHQALQPPGWHSTGCAKCLLAIQVLGSTASSGSGTGSLSCSSASVL